MISAITHKLTAFVLVFILFAHNINTLVIVGDFLVNQDFIAKTLCIQKEDQKGCNGKCQLSKQLSENTPNSNGELPLQVSKRINLDVFCISDIYNLEKQSTQYKLPQILLSHKSPKIVKTFLDIDTPPPIFS